MTYAKAYFWALFAIAKIQFLVGLAIYLLFSINLSLVLLYFSVFSAIGGPIGLLIRRKENAK